VQLLQFLFARARDDGENDKDADKHPIVPLRARGTTAPARARVAETKEEETKGSAMAVTAED
jgi:hypothetical protein